MKTITRDNTKPTTLDFEVYRLFVNNLFNLISYTKAKKPETMEDLLCLRLSDDIGVKHIFYYSNDLGTVIYKNLAGSVIFNPNMDKDLMKFLGNFNNETIKKELENFEIELNIHIDNL